MIVYCKVLTAPERESRILSLNSICNIHVILQRVLHMSPESVKPSFGDDSFLTLPLPMPVMDVPPQGQRHLCALLTFLFPASFQIQENV
jgi:hypothetical protein